MVDGRAKTAVERGVASSAAALEWPVPWQPVWGERNGHGARMSSRALGVFMEGAGRLPERVVELGIRAMARLVKTLDARHSATARSFLRQALGELPPRELEARVVQAYRHLFFVSLDAHRYTRTVIPERTLDHFELRICDEAHDVARSGKGCILSTPHLGSWEAALAGLPWLGFHPVFGIARAPKNRPLSIALQQDRERRGIRLLPRRGAMRDASRIIAAGGSIALMLDQRALIRPILAPFFGRLARCDRSAAVLVKRLGVPVLIGACYLVDGPRRYRMEIPTVLHPEELAGADVLEITTRVNQAYERLILARPEQYFWLHDRYKDTPEAAPVEENETASPGASAERPLTGGAVQT